MLHIFFKTTAKQQQKEKKIQDIWKIPVKIDVHHVWLMSTENFNKQEVFKNGGYVVSQWEIFVWYIYNEVIFNFGEWI